jgi:hypothetical protein
MRLRTLVTAAAAALLLFAVSQPVGAQERYDFKVPFDFVAGGRTFTAGQYALFANPAGDVVTLESMGAKGAAVMLPVETRVAERRPMTEPEVVFDTLNGQRYVSELLIPENDGYLLLITKAKHTHELLKGARNKK